MSRLKLLLIPLWAYLALWFLAVSYAFMKGRVDPGNSELAGVPLILLGLPWSFIFHGFNPKMIYDDYNNAILVCSFFMAGNAILLWLALLGLHRLTARYQRS